MPGSEFVVCECGRHGDYVYPGVRCVCGRIVKNADEQDRIYADQRRRRRARHTSRPCGTFGGVK